MHSSIHLTNCYGNPNHRRATSRNVQSTKSNTFWRSTLNTHLGELLCTVAPPPQYDYRNTSDYVILVRIRLSDLIMILVVGLCYQIWIHMYRTLQPVTISIDRLLTSLSLLYIQGIIPIGEKVKRLSLFLYQIEHSEPSLSHLWKIKPRDSLASSDFRFFWQ